MATTFSFFIFIVCIMTSFTVTTSSKLTEGFYDQTCPSVQQVIFEEVRKAVTIDPGVGAGLIRLLFHDCFVRGCDASILIDSTVGNPSEKDSLANLGVRGYEAIDDIKNAVEEVCPGVVSCADIIAFAARDAATVLGGVHYRVPSGRRDGTTSLKAEPLTFLPNPFTNVSVLEDVFAKKGLTSREMVVLSGAHSVGVAHCGNILARLYSRNDTISIDPTLDPSFANVLTDICPGGKSINSTVPLDFVSSHRLDNVYYKNIRKHRVVLVSDQVLQEEKHTKKMVKFYAHHDEAWKEEFGKAMLKMSLIDVLVGEEGQIRKNCRVVYKDNGSING